MSIRDGVLRRDTHAIHYGQKSNPFKTLRSLTSRPRFMRQTILIFSAIAVSLLILLNLRKLSILSAEGDEELWTTVFGAAFIIIGIGLSRFLFPQKSRLKSDEIPDPEAELKKLRITQREFEVLKLVAEGHSNQEISSALFISESTVKTHVSNVMMKLDARRRTQAVQKAKELKIL